MVNSLTREASVRFGPLLLETLVKHYFDRILKDNTSGGRVLTKLRKDELLYDEAFIIVKMFLEAASKHTVEELQKFSNTRTPAPPWVHVVKVLVPMSCCDDAAEVLVKVFGGEEMTKKVIGGTKWWQVRGLKGVDSEWIAAKKDWQEAKKRDKMQEKVRSSTGSDSRKSSSRTESPQPGVPEDASPSYQPEMDEMRCILYAHGGGYYFGSIDQERYAIQRFARKINGRVFAINYRLAPQYPFPCALQDLLAAYLFLIRPPEGALHRPVNPEHIVVSGDSAGGGLSIALLQVLRDAGLPMPAGGVLVSPWCDLTHSFPSIHTNTATDVIPPYGLSFNKPSTLWPPPPDELQTKVRETLRSRIQQAVSLSVHAQSSAKATKPAVTPQDSVHDLRLPQTGQTLHLGSTASLPTIHSDTRDQSVSCVTSSGQKLTIHEQIHLYTPNSMLIHPLVSPVMSFMGGLPPLLVIAGDAEVLRDEIIYMAHKAANPEKYPIKDEVRELYPSLKGIEERFGPTQVHLQVYDDAAHILPILFSFTTPAKYCFRGISTFIKYVTGMLAPPSSDSSPNLMLSPPTSPGLLTNETLTLSPIQSRRSSFLRPRSATASREPSPRPRGGSLFTTGSSGKKPSVPVAAEDGAVAAPIPRRSSFRQTMSVHMSRAGILFKGGQKAREAAEASPASSPSPESQSTTGETTVRGPTPTQENSVDVGGPRFYGSGFKEGNDDVRRAGEPSVYNNGLNTMIRERISTHGVVRAMESEDQMAAFSLPDELIGVVSELAMRRYIDAKTKFDKKFVRTYKTIEKHRHRNLDIAGKHAMRNMMQLQTYIARDDAAAGGSVIKGVKDGIVASGSWSWAWALDMDEKPPASSIVARRDTHEAVELARIADQSVLAEENFMSGNNLWSLMVNFLTTTPDKHRHEHARGGAEAAGHEPQQAEGEKPPDKESKRERIRSKFAQLVSDGKKQRSSVA